jgi:hypothetical protein
MKAGAEQVCKACQYSHGVLEGSDVSTTVQGTCNPRYHNLSLYDGPVYGPKPYTIMTFIF